MEIAFFCENTNLTPPVEQFLIDRYGKNLDLLPEERVKIASLWKMGLEQKGICTNGVLIKKYRGYDALCLKTQSGKILIRFPFYRDVTNNRLVLLLGFIKIHPYNKDGKESREETRQLDKAQNYYNQYNLDNSKYKITKYIKDLLEI